jgi:hypothetical protein
MPYLNPFAALDLSPDAFAEADAADLLKREKKRLLAEFELADGPVIELRGQALDKSQVLKMFERLEREAEWPHHRRIYEQPELMAFLEEASLDYFYHGDISLLPTQPKDFLRFIGTYFAEQFNQRLYHAFRQKDQDELTVLCRHPLVIPNEYHAACYKDTYRDLHARMKEVEGMATSLNEGQKPDGRVQEVCDEWLLAAFNALPAYFDGIRDRYGLALESLALALHNEHQRVQLAIFVLRQGLKLELTDDTQARLKHVLDQLLALSPGEALLDSLTGGDPETRKWLPWAVAAGGGLLVYALVKWLGK